MGFSLEKSKPIVCSECGHVYVAQMNESDEVIALGTVDNACSECGSEDFSMLD